MLGRAQRERRDAGAAPSRMTTALDHAACVDAWLVRAAHDQPAPLLLEAFERAFSLVWRRAERTLGDVTLVAIADRVLYTAVERYPFLAPIEIHEAGLRCAALTSRVDGLAQADLLAALRFAMLEFLSVLGNLTAEILTPALHAALLSAADGGRQDPKP